MFVSLCGERICVLSLTLRRPCSSLRRGDDMVGNPHGAQIYQFGFFQLIISLKLDKQLSIEQFEAAVSQSTVSSPPLNHEALTPLHQWPLWCKLTYDACTLHHRSVDKP